MIETLAQDTTDDLQQLNALLDAAEAGEPAAQVTPDNKSPQDKAGSPNRADSPLGDDGKAGSPTDDGSTPTANPSKPAGTADPKAGQPQNDQKPPDGQSKPKDDPQDDPKASRYAKEMARQERSWKAINERKSALDQREAELAKREAEMVRRAAQSEGERPRYTAEQYERAAAKFEADGKYDLAEAAREKAKELKANPQADAQARQGQASARQQQALDASWAKVKADMPEALDKSHPFNAALRDFIAREPDVLGHPNGPYLAAQFVRAQLAAAQAEGWRKEVETLRAKVKELEAQTTVPGGGLNRTPRIKEFHEMSSEEQAAELQRQYQAETGA